VALTAFLGLAWADPVAQRSVADTALVVGPAAGSAATPVGPVSLGVEASWDGAAVGVSAGVRAVADRPGWRAAGVAVSALALPRAGGVGLGVAPWVGLGTRRFAATLAAPLAVGSAGSGRVRLPLLAGLEGLIDAGPLAVGARLALGPVWTPGLDVSLGADVGLVVARAGRPGG
jgi:hypothetical protein